MLRVYEDKKPNRQTYLRKNMCSARDSAERNLVILVLLLVLAAPVLLSACDFAETETCGDGTGRPAYERVGEYMYADWGPNNQLVVRYTPMDSTGSYHNLIDQEGLYLLNTDGTGLRPLILDKRIGPNLLSPAWSPDGKWIAFIGGGQIYKIRPDGTELMQVTHDKKTKLDFSWGPASDWIVYKVIWGRFVDRGLWIVSADGDSLRQLTKPPKKDRCLGCTDSEPHPVHGPGVPWDVSAPNWSPGGKKIAYVATEFNNFDNNSKRIALYDMATADVEFIDDVRGSDTLFDLEFSPDGSRILFWTSAPVSIGVINRDGTGLRWLVNGIGTLPHWSPDGSQIIYRIQTTDFCHYQDPGFGELWIMNADGSDKRQITYTHGFNNEPLE